MLKKTAIIVSLLTFSLLWAESSTFDVKASSDNPVHNLNTSLAYESIQEAIDSSDTSTGHTIFIEAGTYYESIIVDKPISLIGEDKVRTIIDANRSSRATLSVMSNNVSISHLTLTHSGGPGQDGGGLVVGDVGNVQISDIISCNNEAHWGVHLTPYSHDVNITRTTIVNNSAPALGGLLLNGASRVNLYNNTITKNKGGINCMNCSAIEVHWNDIYGNTDYDMQNNGVEIVNATYNYWGASGLKISGNILHNPWLTESIFPFALAILNPVNGMAVGLTITIEVYSPDLEEMAKVEYYLQDVLIGTMHQVSANDGWELDTTRYPNGEYTITAKAFDNLGSMKACSTKVTINNIEAPWWKTDFWTIIQVLVGVGGLLLAVLTYVVGKKRKEKKSDS